MKSVIVRPRFQCDFCNRRSVKHVIARHEPTCYLNPNRVCCMCLGVGVVKVQTGEDEYGHEYFAEQECGYCEKYKEIQESLLKEKEEFEKLERSLADLRDLF